MRRGVVAFTSLVLVLGCSALVWRDDGAAQRHTVSLLSFTIPFKTPQEAKAIEELYSPQASFALSQPMPTIYASPAALSALPPTVAQPNPGASSPIAAGPTASLSALPPTAEEGSTVSASNAAIPPTQVYAQVTGELKPVNMRQQTKDARAEPPSAQVTSATPPQALQAPSKSLVSRADSDVNKLAVQNLEYRSKIAQLKAEVAKLSASKQAEAKAVPVSNAKLVVRGGGGGGGSSSSKAGGAGARAGAGAAGLQQTIARDEASITTLTSEVKRLKLIDDGQYGILYRHLQHVDAKLKRDRKSVV